MFTERNITRFLLRHYPAASEKPSHRVGRYNLKPTLRLNCRLWMLDSNGLTSDWPGGSRVRSTTLRRMVVSPKSKRSAVRCVGCASCTRRVEAGEHERCSRWAGRQKVECGFTSDERHKTHSQFLIPSMIPKTSVVMELILRSLAMRVKMPCKSPRLNNRS